MCKVMAHVQHVRQMVLNLNNQVRNPTYECCEWYGCALACGPIPACEEQSYPCTGS